MENIQRHIILLLLLSIAVISAAWTPDTKSQEHDPAREIDAALNKLHEYGLFNGTVLAAKGDDIIYHEAFGKASFEWNIPNSTDTRFKIASITKTYTAVLVMYLVEAGQLSLDDVITDHLPGYPSATGERITLEHLLTQTDGIPDYLKLPGFLEETAICRHDKREFIDHFAHLNLEFEPGTDWSYGNSGYYLLGLIIEQVTGMSYEQALEYYILQPAGLRDTGYASSSAVIERLAAGYVKTPAGYERAPFFHSSAGFSAGMLYATAEDLYRLTRELYDGNLIQNRNYLQNMLTPHAEDYGFGVFIGNQQIGDIHELVVGHSGNIHGFSSQLSYFAFHDYTLIILDNTQQCTARIFFVIRDLLFGYPAPDIREPISGILGSVIEEMGVEEAVNVYRELMMEREGECDISLNEFIILGSHYLDQGKPETAVIIFELAKTVHPYASRLNNLLIKARRKAGLDSTSDPVLN